MKMFKELTIASKLSLQMYPYFIYHISFIIINNNNNNDIYTIYLFIPNLSTKNKNEHKYTVIFQNRK